MVNAIFIAYRLDSDSGGRCVRTGYWASSEISVGIMIALIGGPFFVFLVKRWKISQL